jgi:hypothetical protein
MGLRAIWLGESSGMRASWGDSVMNLQQGAHLFNGQITKTLHKERLRSRRILWGEYLRRYQE